MFNFKNKKNGFTLIELLVVVSIISLLSSIVLSSLSSARMKARDTRRMQDLHQMQIALEMYRNDNGGKYPISSNAGCGTDWCNSTSTTEWNALGIILQNSISKLPIDPLNIGTGDPFYNDTTNYSYAYKSGSGGSASCVADNSCYDLVAKFEDPTNPYRCQLKNYRRLYDNSQWVCTDATFSKRIYSPQN